MATITILCGPDGPLTHIRVPLAPGKFPQRSFYGCAEFMEDLTKKLPTWGTGRLKAPQTPQQQMDDILYRWIAGERIKYGRMFQDLMPASDEVWEMKTADLRIFGWIYRPKVFIAAILGYADHYKHPTQIKSYEDARNDVMEIRS